MNKSIWYITKYFAPETPNAFGGRGHSLMKELARLGHDVTVISSDSNNLTDLPLFKGRQYTDNKFGYRLILLKTMKYTVAKSVKRISSWLHFEWNLFCFDVNQVARPNVVIVSSLSLLTIFYGLYLRLRFRCRLIFEVRDIWPLTIIEEGGFSDRNPFVRVLAWIERLAYSKSDHIIGTMPNLKQHVESVVLQHPPVSCIPMGVDLDVREEEQELSNEYVEKYLRPGPFTVIYAGTVGITNALEPFFEAARLMQDQKDIRFVVIGDGALRSQYMQKYHLSNLVFAPKVKRYMVQSALKHADLLFLSTYKSKVWEYGQSLNKIIDYMKSGKPILASYSGYPSMINEAFCGEFIPAGDIDSIVDAVKRFKAMPLEKRLEMGARGQSWIYENRSYTKLALEFQAIINV